MLLMQQRPSHRGSWLAAVREHRGVLTQMAHNWRQMMALGCNMGETEPMANAVNDTIQESHENAPWQPLGCIEVSPHAMQVDCVAASPIKQHQRSLGASWPATAAGAPCCAAQNHKRPLHVLCATDQPSGSAKLPRLVLPDLALHGTPAKHTATGPPPHCMRPFGPSNH